MKYMFYGCSNLLTLNLSSSFNTSSVKDMGNMFNGCSGLSTLDLSNFNTSNVTTIGGMFKNCSGLSSLNLSNFDTSKVADTGMVEMFYSCSNLSTITITYANAYIQTALIEEFGGTWDYIDSAYVKTSN